MEKTILCNLLICSIKNRDSGWYHSTRKFYPRDIDTLAYDKRKGNGSLSFEIRGDGHVLKYKHSLAHNSKEPGDSDYIKWDEVFNDIQKENYIGCQECIYKYKYQLSKRCDKAFQLNRKVLEWKGYGGKRGQELEEMNDAIRRELGDAFFRV